MISLLPTASEETCNAAEGWSEDLSAYSIGLYFSSHQSDQTDHSVPSTSNTIPFSFGASLPDFESPAPASGANVRGIACIFAQDAILS